MSFIRNAILLSAITAFGCGATTSQTVPRTTPSSTPQDTVPSGPTEVNSSARGVIPVGQELDVRLQTPLSSETSTVEQRFETTTAVDLTQDGRVLVPAGSVVRGVVTDVKQPGRIDRDDGGPSVPARIAPHHHPSLGGILVGQPVGLRRLRLAARTGGRRERLHRIRFTRAPAPRQYRDSGMARSAAAGTLEPSKLFLAQRDQRIDARGAPGR